MDIQKETEDNKQEREEAMETAAGFVDSRRILVPETPGIFRFTVDYGVLSKRKTSDSIAEHFPIVGDGVADYEGYYFFAHSGKISSEDAVREIEHADKNAPWSPAGAEHMFSLTSALLTRERRWIVGLGSATDIAERKRVLCWRKDGSEPRLVHLGWAGEWNAVFAFFAVRRVLVS